MESSKEAAPKPVSPDDLLHVPKRRRLSHTWVEEPAQPRQLFIYYGLTEICFDEPELLTFGQKLLTEEQFRAQDAIHWSDADPLPWEKVKEMLEALVAEGVLSWVDDRPATKGEAPATTAPEPTAPKVPRTWSSEDSLVGPLMQELIGLPLPAGQLEVVIPAYRVAHPALDTDGRQMGEGNVTPRPLFLDLPTERRSCNYAGSRYQDEKSMNVTALKIMLEHWDTALGLTAEIRRRFLERSGRPVSEGPLPIGELHLLALSTLALPGYVMLRAKDPVPNGQLDARLSSVFRIVDGVRMATSGMLVGTGDSYRFEDLVDGEQLLDYCERSGLFLGLFGVCAGPLSLMRQFMKVLVEGTPVVAPPGVALADLVSEVDSAFDYGLSALQLECAVFSFLQAQLRHAEALATLLAELPAAEEEALAGLQTALRAPRPELLPRAAQHYPETFREAGRRWKPPVGAQELGPLLRVERSEARELRLAGYLKEALKLGAGPRVHALARIVDQIFAEERRALATVDALQRAVNDTLGRALAPPLSGPALGGRFRLQGFDLPELLSVHLGLKLERSSAATRLWSAAGELVLVG